MEIAPIKTKRDYRRTFKEMEGLMMARLNTPALLTCVYKREGGAMKNSLRDRIPLTIKNHEEMRKLWAEFKEYMRKTEGNSPHFVNFLQFNAKLFRSILSPEP